MKEKNEFYEKNLERVNYWLQFAETKNAAVVVFVVAVLAVIYGGDFIKNTVLMILVTSVYVVALIIAIISHFPTYENNVSIANGVYSVKDNLLYWKDISKYTDIDYLKEVNKRVFNDTNENFTNIQKMYAEETITNARIAKVKYRLFDISIRLVVFGTAMLPVCLIVAA